MSEPEDSDQGDPFQDYTPFSTTHQDTSLPNPVHQQSTQQQRDHLRIQQQQQNQYLVSPPSSSHFVSTQCNHPQASLYMGSGVSPRLPSYPHGQIAPHQYPVMTSYNSGNPNMTSSVNAYHVGVGHPPNTVSPYQPHSRGFTHPAATLPNSMPSSVFYLYFILLYT